MNVVRMNQRNCGGTDALSPTLYHSGRSQRYGRGRPESVAARPNFPVRIRRIFHGRQSGAEARRGMGKGRAAAIPRSYGGVSFDESRPHPRMRCICRAIVSMSITLCGSFAADLQTKARLFPGKFDTSRLRGVTSFAISTTRSRLIIAVSAGADGLLRSRRGRQCRGANCRAGLDPARGQRSFYPHSSGNAAGRFSPTPTSVSSRPRTVAIVRFSPTPDGDDGRWAERQRDGISASVLK